MTVYRIPTPSGDTPFSDQRTALDGREYVLAFLWNQRESAWYLYLSDESGTPIASSKIVVNVPLFRRVQSTRKPPGWIVALSEGDVAPGLNSLGDTVVLYYYDAAETLLGNTAPVNAPIYEQGALALPWLMIGDDLLYIGDGDLLYLEA